MLMRLYTAMRKSCWEYKAGGPQDPSFAFPAVITLQVLQSDIYSILIIPSEISWGSRFALYPWFLSSRHTLLSASAARSIQKLRAFSESCHLKKSP